MQAPTDTSQPAALQPSARAQRLIDRYALQAHPEGGFYSRIYTAGYGFRDARGVADRVVDGAQTDANENVADEMTTTTHAPSSTWRVFPRPACTSIHFLLPAGHRSHWHRIACDELWYFQGGGPMYVAHIDEQAQRIVRTRLGAPDDDEEEDETTASSTPFTVVRAGQWFAAYPAPGTDYSFVSCVVPGAFYFDEFEIATSADLQRSLPQVFDANVSESVSVSVSVSDASEDRTFVESLCLPASRA